MERRETGRMETGKMETGRRETGRRKTRMMIIEYHVDVSKGRRNYTSIKLIMKEETRKF
jgi:hypothetical protein